MKRIIALILAALAVLMLFAACGGDSSFQCDFCGETITNGKKHTYVDPDGTKYAACDDCYEQLKELQDAFKE